jgi:hypothetical protein
VTREWSRADLAGADIDRLISSSLTVATAATRAPTFVSLNGLRLCTLDGSGCGGVVRLQVIFTHR